MGKYLDSRVSQFRLSACIPWNAAGLPGPPAFAREASEGCRAEAHLGEGGRRTRATARQATLPGRKANAALAPNQNIENNPMQSSIVVAGIDSLPAKTF
jgi:hypothetical protein